MNPIAARMTLQPVLSTSVRIAGALAAAAVLAAGVSFATEASHEAVVVAHASMNPAIVYVTLPRVEVIGRRQAGEPVAEVSCVKPQRT